MHELLLSFKFALKSLFANAGRTLLTMSGVVIGTIAVLVVLSSGDAVERFVADEIESYGSNSIQIEVKVPSAARNSSGNAEGIAQGIQITTLTIEDAEAIGKLSGVSDYYAGVIAQSLVSYRDTNKQVFLLGASASAPRVDRNITVSEGEFYTVADDRGAASVIVLGSGVKDAFFGDNSAVGKSVSVKGQSYRVVGVLSERGSTGFVNFDDFAYIPLETAQKKILGIDSVSFITASARDEEVVEETAIEIDALLRDRHDIRIPGEEDYSVTTIKEAQKLVASVFAAIRLLLLALASISLVVGGVGIMNVMFVSVAERTSEIGLRKAVGARPRDILRQFLIEAVIVGFLGGIIGIASSFLILKIAFGVIATLGYVLPFAFSVSNIVVAIGFSLSVGVLFGTSPAWKASRIDPIRAIREG